MSSQVTKQSLQPVSSRQVVQKIIIPLYQLYGILPSGSRVPIFIVTETFDVEAFVCSPAFTLLNFIGVEVHPYD